MKKNLKEIASLLRESNSVSIPVHFDSHTGEPSFDQPSPSAHLMAHNYHADKEHYYKLRKEKARIENDHRKESHFHDLSRTANSLAHHHYEKAQGIS